MKRCDFLVIGAGMAGASAAFSLSARGSVIVAEAESQPGYHTTGRSAAFFSETYGNAVVRALTKASRGFLEEPPEGFAPGPLVADRGVLHIGRSDQRERVKAMAREAGALVKNLRLVDGREACAMVPILWPAYVDSGLFEPDAKDIDVHALHQGYLKGAKAQGAEIVVNASVHGLRREGDWWLAETAAGVFAARVVVNAAGAWGDRIAALAGARPLGLEPKRRTVVIAPAPKDPDRAHGLERWPLVIDIDEKFYFKPESGRILISPCDETPAPPCDAQPDEADIAAAIDRVQTAADLPIPRLINKWAGLRTFAPDRSPVVGFDARQPGFFWFVGQGGYGIQTAPAMSRLAGSLATGLGVPVDIAALGVKEADLSPGRFGTR